MKHARRVVLALWLACALWARGDEKLVLLDDLPRHLTLFETAADGSRLFFGSGSTYYVFDGEGKLVDKFGLSGGAGRELVPLPNGWFIAFNSHASGHIAFCRPDGSPVKKLVTRGGDEKHLRHDMTGWTSPTGGAVDFERQRIFALDTSMAQRGFPDPWWSRIAIFDLNGKYVGDIGRFDHKTCEKNDPRRTWYDDIEVDPARQRVYATARRSGELLAFSYDGKPAGKAPGRGGIAVFPDGRVAVVAGGREVQLYDADLKPLRKVAAEGVLDLEADAQGRLYASVHDPSITFIRWTPDLAKRESFGPRYRRVRVDFPANAVVAGEPLVLKVSVEGRPTPPAPHTWQVMLRPTDGSDLRWQCLPAEDDGKGSLKVTPAKSLRGFHEIAVRFGDGPIALADRARDLTLQKTFAFRPPGAERSVAMLTASGRTAFRQGEAIPLHIVRRGEKLEPTKVTLGLSRDGVALCSAQATAGANFACEVPAELTQALIPGRYVLAPAAEGHESYPLAVHIAAAEADSPMQRILYHEFDNEAATMRQGQHLGDAAERLAFIRQYAEAAHRLGFTRETDRLVGKLNAQTGPTAWRRGHAPADLRHPGFAPADAYAIPHWNAQWEAECYLDQAVRFGLTYDSQLLGHCSGVRFRDAWLDELVPILQRAAQWFGRYPSFYGFNYNDEMFFGQWVTDWKQEDKDWLKGMHEGELKGRPMADVYMAALRKMYGAFNAGVRQAHPGAKTTATPMWQFPAVDGSYPPVIYEGMDESYSHYLSEGYHYPWYPAHSVDALRRPGKPLMGVFDNSYSGQGGDCYLQDLMQVLGRGVQGAGAQHTRPFNDARGASAYRVGNLVAKMYGPLFAECPPANEAAVLYSYAQDVTERRNSMGTPHWERVFALHTAGLMAGVPMSITFEEDVAAGWLLDDGKPRVPMLFLVGQTKPLPPKVQAGIGTFVEAGGKVFTDAESADYPGATKLAFKTHELKSLWHEGYAADTIYPFFQPVQEKLAAALRAAVGQHRRFPVDTDTPWVGTNLFDGGAVRYIVLATDEGSPYPWDAGTVWSLGAVWRFSVLPKTAAVGFPTTGGVVYDVLEHTIVKPKVRGGRATLTVDMRVFPGRLYALAPAELGAPRVHVRAGRSASTPRYEVTVVDRRGRAIAARVPVRIRLLSDGECVLGIYRGTDAGGKLQGEVHLPGTGETLALEVTELLGGKGSIARLPYRPTLGEMLTRQPEAEQQRVDQGIRLLKKVKASGALTAVLPDQKLLPEKQRTELVEAFAKHGVKLSFAAAMPNEATPGLYLAMGCMPRRETLGDLLWAGWQRGLFESALSEHVPGPGRGLVATLFAVRGHEEHCIAVVGGDAAGLAKAARTLIGWLDAPTSVLLPTKFIEVDQEFLRSGQLNGAAEPGEEAEPAYAVGSKAARVLPVPRLRELAGARLDGLCVAADGKHLLVTAKGYLRNVALIEDRGTGARVRRAVRIGQAPTVGGTWVSPDGRSFGASARVAARFGQGLHLVDAASGRMQVFAAFGDIGRHQNHFAVSADGGTLVAPGTHGVVCWKRDRTGPFWNRRDAWREAWAIDYWKQWADLDWPVADKAERIPQFHAFIPRGADHALVLFGEFSNQGWVTPDNPCSAWLAAVDLATGAERWRFDVPIFKTLLFPTLHTSPSGERLLLQIQMGSWNKETFRFFTVAGGKATASWDSKVAPMSVSVADGAGRVALVFKRRLLEVREPDGSLVYNLFWKSQPVSVAFDADGSDLYVADDAGLLTRLGAHGREVWQADLGCVASLAFGLARDRASAGGRIYAAGWDGRLRCFAADGKPVWTLDTTPALCDEDPMAAVAASAKFADGSVVAPRRPRTTLPSVPEGENLLRTGAATLTLGGTPSWMSNGKLQVKPEALTNGKADDVATPWLHLDELFWDATAGRQVWAEVAFKKPTDVHWLTVRENPDFPASWPTEGLVQVWDEELKRWDTAARGVFLEGPVNTYALDLEGVSKIRYVPWNSYYRNFYTSELEVR